MTSTDSPYRPLFHFTPEKNWMNDPNGLLYHQGKYHLFFQYNPYAKEWGHMSWGHAVSSNLLDWEHLPVALEEDVHPDGSKVTAFSGTAVSDEFQDTGLGTPYEPVITVFFTGNHEGGPRHHQDVRIAFSIDNGQSFFRFSQNPVIDEGEDKFGDPKVLRHSDSGKWIMVNICGRDQGKAKFYSSEDMLKWKEIFTFSDDVNAPGKWECPDFFPVPVDGDPEKIKWILKVNHVKNDLRITRYFAGDFDGQEFQNVIPLHYTNPGADSYYAELTFNGIRDRIVQMGWVMQSLLPDRPWTGMQSVPRELSLHAVKGGYQLRQVPVREIELLRDDTVSFNVGRIGEEGIPISDSQLCRGRGMDLNIGFSLLDSDIAGIRGMLDGNGKVFIGYSRAGSEMFIRGSGIPEGLSVPLGLDNGLMNIRILTDKGVIEAFGGKGESHITCDLGRWIDVSEIEFFAKGGEADLKTCELYYLDRLKP